MRIREHPRRQETTASCVPLETPQFFSPSLFFQRYAGSGREDLLRPSGQRELEFDARGTRCTRREACTRMRRGKGKDARREDGEN